MRLLHASVSAGLGRDGGAVLQARVLLRGEAEASRAGAAPLPDVPRDVHARADAAIEADALLLARLPLGCPAQARRAVPLSSMRHGARSPTRLEGAAPVSVLPR